jgi:hypothetical protein
MRVELLVPDTAPARGPVAGGGGDRGFGALVDAAGAALSRADDAESAFAAHHGGVQAMVVERARADIALTIAATAAQRTAQAVSTLLGMQV